MIYDFKTSNDSLWQKKCFEMFQRDDWSCQVCGKKECELFIYNKNGDVGYDKFLITQQTDRVEQAVEGLIYGEQMIIMRGGGESCRGSVCSIRHCSYSLGL